MRLHTHARTLIAVAALALTALVPVTAVGAEPSDSAVADATGAPASGASVVDPAPSASSSGPAASEPTDAATATAPAADALAAQGAGTVELDLLSITDFHGHIEKDGSDPGAVTLACEVASARNANANTLFVASGDNVGGSSYTSSILGDQPTIDVLNAIGLTASAVGNHELDQGPSDLTGRILPAATYPYLAANLTGDAALSAEGSGRGTYVTTVDGVRVGFVGVVTDELSTLVSPSGISSLTVNPAIDAANARAADLKDGDDSNGEADVVVVLAHESSEIAAAGLSGNVDAVFGGHTHVPYAQTVTRADGSTLAVVQADHYGRKLGHIELSYDRATGAVAVATAENIDLQASTCNTDAYGVAAIVEKASQDADTQGGRPLAYIATDFLRGTNSGDDMGSNRGTESTASNLLADSFAHWLSRDINPGGGHYIGLMNPGGVRADLLYPASGKEGDGVVTVGEAYAVQPFGNEMAYATLTGAQLRTVLGQQFQPGSSRPVLTLGVSGNVDVILDQDVVDELTALGAEIKAADDPKAEAANRAGEIAELRSRVVSHVYVDGAELGDGDSVVAASNTFLLGGGDGFAQFGEITPVNTGVLDRDVTAAYLQGFGQDSPAGADYVKRQVGMAITPTAEAEVSLRMTGLTFSATPEKALGAISVRASVAGTELATTDIDTTTVAGRPETGRAALTFRVPAGTATRACTQVEATVCYLVDLDLLDATGATVSSYFVEVAAPQAVTEPTTTAPTEPGASSAAPTTAPSGSTRPGESSLARTGASIMIGVVALVLVAGGGALLMARRRYS